MCAAVEMMHIYFGQGSQVAFKHDGIHQKQGCYAQVS